jgi:hypothetical protein
LLVLIWEFGVKVEADEANESAIDEKSYFV